MACLSQLVCQMRVAITELHGRISPVFDVARRLLLVDVEDGREVGRREVPLEESEPKLRAKRVAGLGAQVLICGAISWPLEAMLASGGVRVVPHTCGGIEEVLGAFLSGQFPQQAFLMPGCCRRQRRFRHGRRGGRRGFGPAGGAP